MSSKSKIWEWFYSRKNVLFWKKGQKVKGKWGKKQNNFSLWNFLPQIFTPIHIRQMRHLSFYRTSTQYDSPLYNAANSSRFFFKCLTQEVSLECGVMDGAISHCRLWLMACNSLFDDTILPSLFWMVNTKSYLRNCIRIKKQLHLYALIPIKQKSKKLFKCASAATEIYLYDETMRNGFYNPQSFVGLTNTFVFEQNNPWPCVFHIYIS